VVTALHRTDEALARALADVYDEELAREQQLDELQGAGQHGLPLLAPGPQPVAGRAQHPGMGPLSTPRPGGAQQQPAPRLGSTSCAALEFGMGTQASPPSPDCTGPLGFGRSLAPLLPHGGAARPLAAIPALTPALAVPGRLALPPLRPATLAADGSRAPPTATHRSSASQSLPPPPPLAPPSAAAAPSTGWATFRAADAPPRQPYHSTPAMPSAGGPDGAILHGNPLGSFDGTVPNPLGASQTPLAIQAGPQHSAVPSPVKRDGTPPPATSSFWPCAANMQNCHQAPSRPADGRLAPHASAQQLPDLIRLQSPEPPPLQPAPTASAVAMPGTTIGHCD
jgi:hypothetical protein